MNSSATDDKGEKRFLYESLKIVKYWSVDVQNIQIFAFAIADAGSQWIAQSQVLPRLAIKVIKRLLKNNNLSKKFTFAF